MYLKIYVCAYTDVYLHIHYVYRCDYVDTDAVRVCCGLPSVRDVRMCISEYTHVTWATAVAAAVAVVAVAVAVAVVVAVVAG